MTDYTPELIKYALLALRGIYKKGYEYKKVGIMFNLLTSKENIQSNLFQEKDTKKQDKIMKVFDTMNKQYGQNTLSYASSGIQRSWKMKSNHRSQEYTTNWNELLIAKL